MSIDAARQTARPRLLAAPPPPEDAVHRIDDIGLRYTALRTEESLVIIRSEHSTLLFFMQLSVVDYLQCSRKQITMLGEVVATQVIKK